MINECIVIHLLVLVCNSHTTQIDLCSTSCQCHLSCIACRTVMKRHTIQQYVAVCLLMYVQVVETYCTVMCFFQLIKVEYCIFTDKSFYNLRREEIHLIHSMVANQQLGLCSFFEDNQNTTVHHRIDIGTQDINQLDRSFHYHILRNIHQYTVLCKHRIERYHTIFRRISQLSVIFFHQFRMLFCHILQTAEYNSFR